jgi:hypothetical protein
MRYKDIIDFTLAVEDRNAVDAALTIVEEKLPFLIGLTTAETRRMANLGQKNDWFVTTALEAGRQNPSVLPNGMSMAAVERDVAGLEQLLVFTQRVQRLHEKLTHTNRALGADLYAAARAIYKAMQEFGRDAGLGDLLQELSRRFKPRNKQTVPDETETAGNETSGGTAA